MPYDGTIGQGELEQRSEQVAISIFNALNQMDNFFEKVASFSDGRTDNAIATEMFAKDKNLDTTRFSDVATLEAFIVDVRALATALNAISVSVSADNRADIVKFA